MTGKSDRSILANMVKHIQDADDPLTHLVERYLMERDLPKYKRKRLKEITLPLISRGRPGGRLSPSSICGCERQAALKFVGAEGKIRRNPDSEAIFDDGNWRHHKWQARFADMAKMYPKKFRLISIEDPAVVSRYKIAGNLDAHIAIFRKGEWVEYIVDFKGANTFAWDYVFKNQKPKHEHVRQLLAYMKAKGVRRGLLVYEEKNTNSPQVFLVKMSKKDWAEVAEWCDRVLTQMKRKQLPPMHPDCDHGRYLYGRCQFKDLCWGSKPPAEVERMAYEGFPGVNALWQTSLEEQEV